MNPDYRDAIYQAVRRIPAGRTCAYGDVAKMAGLPGRARLVGRALKELPAGHTLPWYRVLRADRTPAFPPGSDEFERQKKLLQAEGVELIGTRVPKACFGFIADEDFALWGPKPD